MLIRFVFAMFVAGSLAFSVGPAVAETGTVKASFVYSGKAFDPAPIVVNQNQAFCGKFPLVNERVLVNKANNGIKNVSFYVYTGRGGSSLPPQPPRNIKVTLANDKCRFEPRIAVLQAGDKLEITNPDDIGHNANLNFFFNPQANPLIPPGGAVELPIDKPEPAPVPVECNIHPWMRAYVIALDHPFVAVSDEDGAIEISGLPAGEKLTFRISHEAADGGIKEITMDGKSVELKKNNFEVMVNPGMNDLGTITIPADSLKVQ